MKSSPNPLNAAMQMLAAQPNAIFLGQGVASDGVWVYDTLDGVPMEQRLEFPVAEELQLGVAIGLSLQGFLPICIYPRMDFLLRAMDQLVNHLDKLETMSCGQFKPKVIIRTRVGSKKPLDAGPQHTQNHTLAFTEMLTNVAVSEVRVSSQIALAYQLALGSSRSTLIVENLG